MSSEEIQLNLTVPESFFTELDRRFDALAKRATQSFGNAARNQGGGLGTAGPSGTSGGSSASPGGVAGAFGNAASAVFNGAAQGIVATPAAASSSPSVLAQNAALGAAQGGVNLLKGITTGAGALAGGALGGPAGALAGGAAGNVLGELIQSQFNSVKEAMEVPTERGVNRLKSIYGNFAAAGVTTTEAEREQAIGFSIQIERRRYEGERGIERQYRELTARDSASYGLSWMGR